MQVDKPHAFFVTGTDTGVGKTRVAASLLAAARAAGLSTAALKPVASGCEEHDGALRNADALMLAQYCSLPLNSREFLSGLPAALGACRAAGSLRASPRFEPVIGDQRIVDVDVNVNCR